MGGCVLGAVSGSAPGSAPGSVGSIGPGEIPGSPLGVTAGSSSGSSGVVVMMTRTHVDHLDAARTAIASVQTGGVGRRSGYGRGMTEMADFGRPVDLADVPAGEDISAADAAERADEDPEEQQNRVDPVWSEVAADETDGDQADGDRTGGDQADGDRADGDRAERDRAGES